jgi:hypothetical protein
MWGRDWNLLVGKDELVFRNDEGAHTLGLGQLGQRLEVVRGQERDVLEHDAVFCSEARFVVTYSIDANRIEQLQPHDMRRGR